LAKVDLGLLIVARMTPPENDLREDVKFSARY
jgi:hypothetical protein